MGANARGTQHGDVQERISGVREASWRGRERISGLRETRRRAQETISGARDVHARLREAISRAQNVSGGVRGGPRSDGETVFCPRRRSRRPEPQTTLIPKSALLLRESLRADLTPRYRAPPLPRWQGQRILSCLISEGL